jgi:hypothetical protein
MKKFLFFILLLVPFWVKAQVYHPLVDSGAVWNVEVIEYGVPFFTYDGYKIFFSGDTIINSVSYRKLWSQYLYYYDAQGPVVFEGANNPGATVLFAAMREDSSKKIFFRAFISFSPFYCYDFHPDSEYLIYDFAVDPGDTVSWMSYPPNVVIGIDSFQLLNGEWRKAIHLEGNPIQRDWIEGIGSPLGLFNSYDTYADCGNILTCYRNNGELLYEEHHDSSIYINCDSLVGNVAIPEFNSKDFVLKIFPNPTSDFLTLNFSSPNFSSAQIKITDVLGRNLFSDKIKSNQPLQIASEKFSGNSMLFCELWQEGKLIGMKKVLIQK